MAMIKCKECGKDISDTVKKCVHCGFVYKKQNKIISKIINIKKTKIIFIYVVLLIIALIGSIYIFNNKDRIIRYFELEQKNKIEKITGQSNEKNEASNQLIITNDYINIRSSNSIASEILGKVYINEIYTILDMKEDDIYNWYKIETSKNVKGYIASEKKNPYVTLFLVDSNNIDVTEEIENNNTNNPNTDNDNNTNTPNNNVNDYINIEITLDNWNIYFEISDSVTWDYDDFGDVEGLWLNKVIQLKREYQNKIAKDCSVSFGAKGYIYEKEINIDKNNKKYTLTDYNNGIKNLEMNETTTLNLSKSHSSGKGHLYGCHDGYYNQGENKIIVINVVESLEMIKVKGNIYISN